MAADLGLNKVDASALLTNNGCTLMAASSYMRFVSHACLKVAKKPVAEMGQLGLKKCTFILLLGFLRPLGFVAQHCVNRTRGVIC